MSVHQLRRPVTVRPMTRADHLCFDEFRSTACVWERQRGASTTAVSVFEQSSRIIAFSRSLERTITPPDWASEPLPVVDEPFADGDIPAFVGAGLWISGDADRETATRIHRLARSLHADQLGLRHAVVIAPLPEVPPFAASEAAQQIVAGAIDHPPVTIPIEEGYWPVAVTDDEAVVLVRKNDAF